MKKLIILFLISSVLFSYSQENLFEENSFYLRIKENVSKQDFIERIKNNNRNCIASVEMPFSNINYENKSGNKLARTFYVKTNCDDCIEEEMYFLSKHKEVEFSERLPLLELLHIPNDPYYVDNIMGANPKWIFTLIGAEQAWSYSTGDPSISVAIIDNAIWTEHPDLQGKFVDIWDFADNNASTIPASSSNDAMGRQWSHGTHVAGLVGATTNNNIGIASIGYNISLRAYKMFSGTSIPLPNLSAGIEAILHSVDDGANIINISWGTTNFVQTLKDACDYAYDNGVIVVAAAGNNGREEQYYPAAYPNTLAITAVGMDDRKSHFSNFGSFIDFTAPGGYGPNDAGTWSPVSTTYHDAFAWASILGNVKYDGRVGTSSAAPIVAGLCGLILSVAPHLTPDEVKHILEITSDNIDNLNASFAGKLGVGRIHAGKALEYVVNNIVYNKDNIINNKSVNIYPNPARDYINICCLDNDKSEWHIYDMSGRLIISGRSKEHQILRINISDLVSGVYNFVIKSPENFQSKVFSVIN